jgi:glutathione synthase/RimK-type ligase-like ATP-grasp enzyme
MNIKILFITNQDDISVDYLISKLKLKTKLYLRIDSEDINIIDFNINPKGEFILIKDNKKYNLKNVISVVFKRTPTKFNFDKKDLNQIYLNNERKHFYEGLYLCLKDVKWINPMFATHIAERKLFQLFQANKFGIETPSSLLTNNSITADKFLKSHKKSIIKPISNGLQVLENKFYSIYTSDIHKDFFSNYDNTNLFETPVLLQERIENENDIRVVIINEKVFAVEITKDDKSEVDWRKPEIEKSYKQIKLPDDLSDKLVKLNKSFNLIYSAIDLIKKPNGKFVFLEINPVGEWVWLESELNLNISETIIKELLWLN